MLKNKNKGNYHLKITLQSKECFHILSPRIQNNNPWGWYDKYYYYLSLADRLENLIT